MAAAAAMVWYGMVWIWSLQRVVESEEKIKVKGK